MGVRIVAAQQVTEFDDQLLALAHDDVESLMVRVDAFAAVAPRMPELDAPLYGFLRDRLTNTEASISEKLRIAAGLTQIHELQDCQIAGMAASLEEFGPVAAAALFPIYERDTRHGHLFVESLQDIGTNLPVSPEVLERTLAGYSQEIRDRTSPSSSNSVRRRPSRLSGLTN